MKQLFFFLFSVLLLSACSSSRDFNKQKFTNLKKIKNPHQEVEQSEEPSSTPSLEESIDQTKEYSTLTKTEFSESNTIEDLNEIIDQSVQDQVKTKDSFRAEFAPRKIKIKHQTYGEEEILEQPSRLKRLGGILLMVLAGLTILVGTLGSTGVLSVSSTVLLLFAGCVAIAAIVMMAGVLHKDEVKRQDSKLFTAGTVMMLSTTYLVALAYVLEVAIGFFLPFSIITPLSAGIFMAAAILMIIGQARLGKYTSKAAKLYKAGIYTVLAGTLAYAFALMAAWLFFIGALGGVLVIAGLLALIVGGILYFVGKSKLKNEQLKTE